ncbi:MULTISPECIES: redox-sensing transcriptional repressor Rex [unclassified Rhodococcus (in: high G+C Gram-positive bacteria)]|uniref:redox-sensing transcriptional repressor Rex n=1 Tax=Rhodococcus sp. SJ-3 TaxID=3454628 RepID=UPI002D92B055|nr:redox-sensing transcriptional repressor Rex [Rhodococcus sp. (in: high G+C Gram-positive bacteria)]
MTQPHPPQGDDARGSAGTGEGATRSSERVAPGSQYRDIPQATVTRLANYLRVLGSLSEAGTLIVSSEELASAAGVGSAKLRKDLSFLGPNGVRGVGYDVIRLQARIENALGLDRGHHVVLVGVGSLGRALACYPGFDRRGFTLAGLFDADPALVGTTVGGLVVRGVDRLESDAHELGATIGVVATPEDAAQDVCDVLVRSGVRSVLSFAPIELEVPEHVEVRRVDLAVELQVLSFNSARNDELLRVAGGAHTTSVQPARGPLGSAVSTPSPARRSRTGKAGPLGSAVTRNGSVIAP